MVRTGHRSNKRLSTRQNEPVCECVDVQIHKIHLCLKDFGIIMSDDQFRLQFNRLCQR